MPDDDLPAVLRNRVRDEDAEEWIPMSGPLEWERRTEAIQASWTDGGESYEGLGVRDSFNEDAYIISTLFAPDLRRML